VGTAAPGCPRAQRVVARAPSPAKLQPRRWLYKNSLESMLKFRQLPVLTPSSPRSERSHPRLATKGEFTSITRTAEELSIVCLADNVSKEIAAHAGSASSSKARSPSRKPDPALLYRSAVEQWHPIFAISTYDTDYVLVQEEFVGLALNVLREPHTSCCLAMNPKRSNNRTNPVRYRLNYLGG